MLALSLLTMLAGCQTSGNIPPLPGNLVTACADPGVRAGKSFGLELARNREALAVCSHKHRDTVTFYGDLRKRLK